MYGTMQSICMARGEALLRGFEALRSCSTSHAEEWRCYRKGRKLDPPRGPTAWEPAEREVICVQTTDRQSCLRQHGAGC